MLLAFALAGCRSNQTATQNPAQPAHPAQDPAVTNLASAGNATDTKPAPRADQPDQPGSYDQASKGYYSEAASETTDDDVAPDPPPDLPDYNQPPAPGDNYIWAPGYWSWSNQGYYWVPGAWVLAPYVGALWTPGYWNYDSGRYRWHHGYWAHHVGYYGGVNYGFGYDGNGYEGGYWHGNDFYYNRDISRVDTHAIHSIYDYPVQNRHNPSHVSYDGGRGGLSFRPTAQQLAAEQEQHIGALPVQQELQQSSRGNRAQFARDNHGHPQMLAESRPVNRAGATSAPSPETFHPITGLNRPASSPSGHTAPGHIGPAPMARPCRPGPAAAPTRQPLSNTPPRNRPEAGSAPQPEGAAEMRPNPPQSHHEPVNSAAPAPQPHRTPSAPRSGAQRHDQQPQGPHPQ